MTNPVALISDVGGVSKFDANGAISSAGTRWTRWKRAFELFAVGKGVNNLEQKKALPLHLAGPSVQDIFYTLVVPDPVDDQNVYDLAVAALDGHFQPQNNAALERATVQLPSETVNQYITRLRQNAVYCDFHIVDENIRDQIIEKCYSQRLRRKLLQRNNVTLPLVRENAQAIEASEHRVDSMEQKEHVNKVSPRKFDRQWNMIQKHEADRQLRCYARGRAGHIRTDANCPAKGKKCKK
jgi:hypothetical protein